VKRRYWLSEHPTLPGTHCVLVCDTTTEEYSVLYEGSEEDCKTELVLLQVVECLVKNAADNAKKYGTDAITQLEAELAMKLHLLGGEDDEN